MKWYKVFVLFFMFGLLLFFNSLNNKFLIDDYVFLSNPVYSDTKFILSQWNPYREQALGVMDSHEDLGYYRPMAHMVLDFCYSTFKNNFWQYHLLNLLLFVLASLLIYLLIEKITGNYNLAFLTGFFYLIHPMNGIMVNYISAIVFACQVICTLGTILLLLKSLEGKNNRVFYILSLVLSFLTLFWNESGVMTPLYICAVILLFRKESFKEKASYLFPYFLIVFAYLVFRSVFVSHDVNFMKQIALFHMSGGEYLASLFQAFAWYISRLFYPQGVVMQWAAPIVREHIILNVLGLVSLFIIAVLLFVSFAKERILRMAIIWTLIGFAPVFLAAFFRMYNGIKIEPHWFVISSIGFFILAAQFCLIVLEKAKNIGYVLLFILFFGWGSISHANNQLWADQKTYALYWSQQDPNLKYTFYLLGDAYQRQGALKESMKYFKMALSGYSIDEYVYSNIGIIESKTGHIKEAELDYKRALAMNPYSADNYNTLGDFYNNQGELKKAKEYFLKALAYNPLKIESRVGLASVFFKNSEYQKAIDLCMKNLDIVNYDTNTLFLLVDIYLNKRDLVSVQTYAYRIINHETDPKVLMKLGLVMAKYKISNVALDAYVKILQVAPDYKEAYLATGTLLESLGKYEQAIHIWTMGSTIDPSDRRFKKDIAFAILKQ